MSGTRGPTRRPPQRGPAAHRRLDPAIYRRRRLAVASALVVIIVLLVGVGLLVTSGPSRSGTGGHGTTTTKATTSATGSVKALGIGMREVTWTDSGFAVNPAPNGSARPRVLVTEIWYPSVGGSDTSPTTGARPDYAGGPFPVIVFAHGFDTLPTTYTALLTSWVRAGFVVVAPLFPDENANEINSLGHPTLTQSEIAESDVINEPYDIAYVAGQVESGAGGDAASGAPWLKGLAEPGKIALAGHSDGGQAVAALVYQTTYAPTYDAMAARPFAVLVLSASELSGTYAPPPSSPPLLDVQSAADTCNLPQDAATLFHDAGGGFFLELTSAHHFSPYVGIGPSAPIVEKITAAFLKAAVAGTSVSSALSAVAVPPAIAKLYPPSLTPVLVALPEPTQAQRTVACAPPVALP